MGPAGAAQTRAGGLTRAILDTFPVIKYAVAPAAAPAAAEPSGKPADEEEGRESSDEIQLKEVATPPSEPHRRFSHDDEVASASGSGSGARSTPIPAARSSMAVEEPAAAPAAALAPSGNGTAELMVAAPAPDETSKRPSCPICILDFEEGEDVRVLPCKGHHIFHRECVDPWLLESSGSCPLCREGASGPRPSVRPRF